MATDPWPMSSSGRVRTATSRMAGSPPRVDIPAANLFSYAQARRLRRASAVLREKHRRALGAFQRHELRGTRQVGGSRCLAGSWRLSHQSDAGSAIASDMVKASRRATRNGSLIRRGARRRRICGGPPISPWGRRDRRPVSCRGQSGPALSNGTAQMQDNEIDIGRNEG